MHMARPNDWLSVEDQYVWWHAEPVTHALVPQQHIKLTSNSGGKPRCWGRRAQLGQAFHGGLGRLYGLRHGHQRFTAPVLAAATASNSSSRSLHRFLTWPIQWETRQLYESGSSPAPRRAPALMASPASTDLGRWALLATRR